MDPVSLALSIFSTLDLCIKYGTKMRNLCREYRRLQPDVDEMILILENVWIKTEVQLELLKTLLRSESLEPALLDHYLDVLKTLKSKINGAVEVLDAVSKRNLSHPRFRFSLDSKAVYLKRELHGLVADLEQWQKRFDPSWYLITRISQPIVDKQLRRFQTTADSPVRIIESLRDAVWGASNDPESSTAESIFKPRDTLQHEQRRLPYTNTYLSQYRNDTQQVILDRTNYPKQSTAIASKAQIRDLARIMSKVDPLTFGLLKCDGVIEVNFDHSLQYEFILRVPKGLHTMRTLRSLLLEEPHYSLTKRFQLSKQLARSVMFVHTVGFVHKGIRPENILVFDYETESNFSSFLTGFEKIRRAEGQTDFLGDLEWDRNVYRHPARQGLWSEEAFKMQHDIYSLGVCLLEIGLWHSFVEMNDTNKTPWIDLDICGAIADKDARRGGHAMKRKFIDMAVRRLPALVGELYTSLVVACLCCLDTDQGKIFNREGQSVKDNDGIIIGVRFIENILSRIEELLV